MASLTNLERFGDSLTNGMRGFLSIQILTNYVSVLKCFAIKVAFVLSYSSIFCLQKVLNLFPTGTSSTGGPLQSGRSSLFVQAAREPHSKLEAKS